MSQHEPEASPQQQEAIRRLLAQARHDEPVPDDVARRLDTVLSQLAAEGTRAVDPPPPPPYQGTVVDLAARRRRRVTGLLGAAAAVVVLGVGATQLIDTTGSDDSSSGDSAGTAEDGGGELAESAPSPMPSREPNSAVPAPSQAAPDVPPISRQTFGDAVLALRDRGIPEEDVSRDDDLTTAPLFVCDVADFGEGDLVAVRYEGKEAVLAYRPVQGTTQVVDLLQCGSGDVLRSKVIPAP
ncbi:hypothetical protein ABFT23_02535 [Nocardioides sp. C4-1]|uniref:hypothetical protein n=1 Tax=Nocardioides sp. C4-1 TaxID=3151851 RepID=UPI00326771E4